MSVRARAGDRRTVLLAVAAIVLAVVASVASPSTFGAFTTSVTNQTNTASSAVFATCQNTTAVGSPYFIYPFAEATGTTVNDTSGNNRSGTYQNTAGLTFGAAGPCTEDTGRAITMNPNNNRTTFINSPAGLIAGPQSFSAQTWFRTSSARGGRLIGFGNGTGTTQSTAEDRHLYLTNAGRVVLGVAPGGVNRTISSATGLNDSTWHHAVGTLSPDTGLRLYVDGVQVAADPTVTSARVQQGRWRVGWDDLTGWPEAPTSEHYQGSLAWAAVHTTALTPTQVQAIWSAGR